MFKKLAHYFAYLLLVLLPLQSLAAANMLGCNNITQTKMQQQVHHMPCHEPMNTGISEHQDNKSKSHHSSNCQSSCAALCASFASIAALPSPILDVSLFKSPTKPSFSLPLYLSANLANLQRPPIHFS